jgi:hypothetical protein
MKNKPVALSVAAWLVLAGLLLFEASCQNTTPDDDGAPQPRPR